MDDLISRKAAIDAIAIEFDECGIEYGPNEVVHRVTCELKHLPTANAIPVEWLCGYLNKIGMKPTDISEMILTWKKGKVNSNG